MEAVAVYMGGRTGAFATAGKEVLATVPCDESFPGVIANLIRTTQAEDACVQEIASDPLFAAAATAGLASWRPTGSFENAVGAA